MKPSEVKTHFPTEAALCEAYAAWARLRGYTVYPETAGWDMLLVDADGRQTGIQAKMDLNLKVIAQALNDGWYHEYPGPDHRAVLVPFTREGVDAILARVGLGIFVPRDASYTMDALKHGLKWTFDDHHYTLPMFDWNPSKRCELPDYVPDVPAGVPAPRTLSPWKVGALRVLAKLEVQGYLTRDDVRECKNDPRRWCASDGWLVQLGGGRWGRGPNTPTFGADHPAIYTQILAEERVRGEVRRAA
jgi:hypothetical protein